MADVEEVEILDASKIYGRTFNAKEVLKPKNGEELTFLWADGTVELVGRDQVSRMSTSTQDHPARGEEHNDVLQGASDGSQPLDQQADDAEARIDFWSISGSHICRHHFQPRVKAPCDIWRFILRTTQM